MTKYKNFGTLRKKNWFLVQRSTITVWVRWLILSVSLTGSWDVQIFVCVSGWDSMWAVRLSKASPSVSEWALSSAELSRGNRNCCLCPTDKLGHVSSLALRLRPVLWCSWFSDLQTQTGITLSFPESPVGRQQNMELYILHDHVSQFLIVNLFI